MKAERGTSSLPSVSVVGCTTSLNRMVSWFPVGGFTQRSLFVVSVDVTVKIGTSLGALLQTADVVTESSTTFVFSLPF